MKQLTVKEVMEALQENSSYEFDNGSHYYNLHITDKGEILQGIDGADESIRVEYFGDLEDDSFDWESEENKDFMEVVKELTEKANEYLEVWGE